MEFSGEKKEQTALSFWEQVVATLEGIPMRSEQTESMFSPDFFGHVGKCGGNCKMDMLQNWDGMAREFNYMPNGNDRASRRKLA